MRSRSTPCLVSVVIEPSLVSVVTKPRGWYRAMRHRLQPRRVEKLAATDRPLPREALGRHFDVVHCLSGGFLQLYVLLRSGVDLTFDTALFDSTPILPRPSSFARFTRAYLASVGLGPLLVALPRRVHQFLVRARWTLSLLYIRAKHLALRGLRRLQGDALEKWTEGPVRWALDNDYDRVAVHALGTLYEAAAAVRGSRLLFLHNLDDPFVDVDEIQMAAELAEGAGLSTRTQLVDVDHVKALFACPRKVFAFLAESAAEVAASPGAPPGREPDREMIRRMVVDGTVG
jgi:hypothetical protein